jgi:protease-4
MAPTMRVPFLVSVCVIFVTQVVHADSSTLSRDVTRGLTIPGGDGISGEFDATALSLNPAGLITLMAPSVSLIGTILDTPISRPGGGYGGFLAAPIPLVHSAIGFGWQSLQLPTITIPGWPVPIDENAGILSAGLSGGGRRAGIGFTYSHVFWEQSTRGIDTVSIGVQTRPSRYWAFGAVLRDAFAPIGRVPGEKFNRSYDLELTLRPLGDARIDLAGGVLIGEEDDNYVDARGRAMFRFIPGISLYGQYESVARRFGTLASEPITRDNRVIAGVTLDMEHAGVSYAALTSSRGDAYAGSSVMLRFSGERYRPIYEPARVIRLHLTGAPTDRDFMHTVLWLRQQEKADSVSGIVLDIDGYGVGWGRVEELRDQIHRLRAAGKHVFAYLDGAGTRMYYLASACEKIFLNPGSALRLWGYAATHLYYKELLEHIGVKIDVVKIGQYKSYPEMFTNTEASAPAREEVETYIRDILERFSRSVAEERHMTSTQVRDLIERGPYLAPTAKENGLVDELKYEDQLGDALRPSFGGRPVHLSAPPHAPQRPFRWSAPQIAVIFVEGDIGPGRSQDIPLWGHVTGGQSVADAIKAARESSSVKAIVLRVDSPGGAVEPSEQIAREVELTRGKKPLIVSMGDIAASGGYMVSARGDRIFAEPSTITGSIGIFYYKADVSGLLDRIGVHTQTLKQGPHSDMESPYRSWTEEEQRIAFSGIAYFYDRFITMVSQGRKMAKAAVDAIARGRVWTAAMAQPALVDQSGGLMSAIGFAKQRAGFSEDAVVDLAELPYERKSELERLMQLAGLQAKDDSTNDVDSSLGGSESTPSLNLPPLVREAIAAIPPILLWSRGLLARLPADALPPPDRSAL